MSKRSWLRTAFIIAFSLLAGVVGGYIASQYSGQQQLVRLLRIQQLSNNKLSSTLSLIDQYYIDSLSQETIVEEMMPLLVGRLDPHTTYIPAKDLNEVNESLDGEFEGIGIVFNMATDTVIILNVIATGPSDKAGLLARDRIITINDSLMAGCKVRQDSIVRQLKGPRGTVVKLGIERSGVDELIEVEVTRDKVAIHSITATVMLTDKTGYINISQFARTTHEELMKATKQLYDEGMESLILDLRGNPGGYLDQAIKLSNEFLPKNTLIVYTEDKTGKQERIYSQYNGSLQSLDVVVLIDETSASSSEILAGALQDNDHGTIIGRRSYGKGLIQRQIPFRDGSALRLTTAAYYTPTGRSIQKPFERGEGDAYERDLLNRLEHNELYTADSIMFVDSLRKVTPKGKVVYGGGGIMPDIFVPVPTDTLPQLFIDVVRRNILYNYTIKYSDRNRSELAKVKTTADLAAMFERDDRLVDDFVTYVKQQEIEVKASELEESRELIETQLRAYIGRNTSLSENGFYINIYPLDDAIMAAIDHLNPEKE
ncbi:MAG: S41 family peptidase [Rikenellaceae bacterium]